MYARLHQIFDDVREYRFASYGHQSFGLCMRMRAQSASNASYRDNYFEILFCHFQLQMYLLFFFLWHPAIQLKGCENEHYYYGRLHQACDVAGYAVSAFRLPYK